MDLQIFCDKEFGEIRTAEINGEPHFVGSDVAKALGYSNTKDAILSHVDGDDRRIIQRSENATFEIPNRGLTLINESGLYSLVLGSKFPSAKKFKRWITSEVIPSIRAHGAYLTDDTLEKALTSPDFLIRLATQLKEEREKNAALETKVEEDKPKVLFAQAVETAKTSILISDLAKLLKQNGIDTGQKRLFEQLRQEGFLMKGGTSHNMPTQRSMDMGLFEVKESIINNPDGSVRINRTTKVTGKGQTYFINKYLGGVKNNE